jgi:hypothetical protein
MEKPVAAACERQPKKGYVSNPFRTTALRDSTIYMSIPEGFEFLH